MKRYILTCMIVVLFLAGCYYIKFYTSFFIPTHRKVAVISSLSKKDSRIINYKNGEFEIKGIDLGSSVPFEDDKAYKISYKTYIKWFKQIKEMNINTIRVYSIENSDFYKALKDFNTKNNDPLYLIQSMDVGDYEENSSIDYFNDKVYNTLLRDVKVMVDVIHGKRIVAYNSNYASGKYNSDVSKWTIAYIIGSEWNDVTVMYTNKENKNRSNYQGKYFKTKKNATPFETFLTEISDKLMSYETERYHEQRLISFGNYAQTDPFTYDEAVSDLYNKFCNIDINNIEITNKNKAGFFASFQVYSGYPDYLSLEEEQYEDSYKEYLKRLNEHFKVPVVISEFGYSTSRGETINTLNDNYGADSLTEEEQGKYTVKAINTMKEVGINNFIIYEWQDEWDKNVWNTMYSVDSTRSQYWHDVETSTNNYGILKFDTGINKSKVDIDGNISEWNKKDIIVKNKNYSISAKYDAEYIYFLINKKNLDFSKDKIYIPIDTTSRSGSKKVKDTDLTFNKDVDFLITINGKESSNIKVQERYNTLIAMYGNKINHHEQFDKENIPNKNSSIFEDINLITSTQNLIRNNGTYDIINEATLVDTGKLIYGNSNHDSDDYNSLGDFYQKGDNIELRIAWGLLNFSDPSTMMIHDDYYKYYGVESYKINKLYIGVGESGKISLSSMDLKPWNNKAPFHERLKESYYIIQKALGSDK